MSNSNEKPTIDVAVPEALEGLGKALRERTPLDFTVTHTKIRTAWSREGTKGFVVSWGTKSAGFGELTLYQNEDGSFRVDDECMGPDFCRKVILHLFKSAWSSYHGDAIEGPLLTEDASVLRNGMKERLDYLLGRDLQALASPGAAEAQVTLLLELLHPEKYKEAYEGFRKERTPNDLTSPLHALAADSKDLRQLLLALWARVEGPPSSYSEDSA
jgi:hypothetical protein